MLSLHQEILGSFGPTKFPQELNVALIAQHYQRDPFYDDDDEAVPLRPRTYTTKQKRKQSTSSQLFKNQRQIGAALTGLGLLLTILGMMLFFEGNLLRLGNISLIIGIPLLVGPDRIRSYFIQADRMQATIILAIGILMVFSGRPRLGIICEIFGLLNLFGNMFPLLVAMGRNLPIIGDIIRAVEGEGNNAKRNDNRKKYSNQF